MGLVSRSHRPKASDGALEPRRREYVHMWRSPRRISALPPRTDTMNSQRRVAMHVAPRTVNRPLLLELAGDNSPEGREDERGYEDGRDHLAHATSVAETAPDHTQHTARNFFIWGCCRALPLPVAGSNFFSCIPESNS